MTWRVFERGALVTACRTLIKISLLCKGECRSTFLYLAVESLCSGLATIVDKCEKALAKHQSRSPIGLMKSYISLSKLEEQIRDLNEEVNHTKQRFMVYIIFSAFIEHENYFSFQIRTQIQQTTVLAEQTTVLATQFTADLSITDQVQALRQGMDKIIHSASEDVKVGRKVFDMATMTIEERKLSLRKASPVCLMNYLKANRLIIV